MSSYLRLLTLASAIAFLINSPSVLPIEVENESLKSIPLEWQNRDSPDFSGDGRPKRTAGGASRSQCQAKNDLPLTAIVPDTPIALTAAASPTFWFYLPYTLTPKHSVEFVLKDNQDRYVYKTKLTGKETSPGITGLQLPPTVTLDAEQNYSWYFVVHCQPQNKNKFVYVNGSIRRSESHSNNSLNSLSPQAKLQLYIDRGLWHDAVTQLAERAIANPQNTSAKNNWTTLLQSVGLRKLASKPFVSCCSLNKRSL